MKKENWIKEGVKMKLFKLILSILVLGFFIFASFQEAWAAKKVLLAVWFDNPDYTECMNSFRENLGREAIKAVLDVEFMELNTKGDRAAFISRLKELESQVDLIFVPGTPNNMAVNAAGMTKPVVFSAVASPTGAKLVKSLERPQTNFTGCHCAISAESQLRALLLTLPKVKRIGVFYNPDDPAPATQAKDWKEAIAKEGLEYVEYFIAAAEVSSADDLARVTEEMIRSVDVDVIVTTQDAKVSPYGEGWIEVVNRHKIPSYSSLTQLVDKGALVSLGFNFPEAVRIVNVPQAIRILKGEDPAAIPVYTFPEYKLIINQKTARRIGVNIPFRALRAASEVIK